MKLKDNGEGMYSTYVSILQFLRKIIDQDYADGGRLPSVRKMCEMIGCNHITYNKAISCLIAEQIIENQYQRGMYVKPSKFRVKKVGLILNSGESCPFMGIPLWTSNLLEKLALHKIHVQVIQGANAEKILNNALIHCVDALIWMGSSNTNILKEAQLIANSCVLPILIGNYYDNLIVASEEFPLLPKVNSDFKDTGIKRAEYFVKQNYKSVIYVGNLKLNNYMNFTEILKKHNIIVESDYLIQPNIIEINEKLPLLLENNNISAVFSGGSELVQKAVLNCCKNIPSGIRPDVILSNGLHTQELCNEYPEINSYIENLMYDGGTVCADILIDYMYNKVPFVSKNIPCTYKVKKAYN